MPLVLREAACESGASDDDCPWESWCVTLRLRAPPPFEVSATVSSFDRVRWMGEGERCRSSCGPSSFVNASGESAASSTINEHHRQSVHKVARESVNAKEY